MNAHASSGIAWSGAVIAVIEALSYDDAKFMAGLAVSVVLGALGLYIHVTERLGRAKLRRHMEEAEARRAEEWADFQQRQKMREVERDGAVTSKVDALWNFVRRRAVSEFLTKGMGISAQPPTLNSEVRKWFDGMAKDLKDFYASTDGTLADKELFLAIEHEFGDRLLHEVCIPNGLSAGACVLAAIAICREPTGL
jgi:hypothetical protein